MRCQQVHEWMSLKLDGQLPAGEAQALEAHLGECAGCAETWAQWEEIALIFAGAPVAGPARDLAPLVLERIRQPRPLRMAASLLAIGLGLALLAVLILGPLVTACSMAMTTVQMPGLAGTASSVLANLARAAAVVAEGVRLGLRAVLTPRSAAVAAAYACLSVAALAGWLRVVVLKKAPVDLAV